MLFAGSLLTGYSFFIQKNKFSFSKAVWMKLFLLAFFAIYVTNVCEFWGLQYLTSFKTCFIYSLSPFLSVLFSYLLFSEKLSLKQWSGLLVGFIGFLPILLSQSLQEEELGGLLFLSWPELAVIGAVVCSVYGWILLKQLVSEEHDLNPVAVNGISMLIGGGLALFHSAFAENWQPIPTTNIETFIECSLLLVLISNLICYNLYGYLLKRYSATFMSFAGFTTPLFTALFGWLFLGETITWPFYLSLVIVFSGLFIFHQEELKHSYRQTKISNFS